MNPSGKSDHAGAVAARLTDETAGLLGRALPIEEHRGGLHGRDLHRRINVAHPVSRFRSSHVLAAPLMRTSESKGHWQVQASGAALDLKFLHALAGTNDRNFKSTAPVLIRVSMRDATRRPGFAASRSSSPSSRAPASSCLSVSCVSKPGAIEASCRPESDDARC